MEFIIWCINFALINSEFVYIHLVHAYLVILVGSLFGWFGCKCVSETNLFCCERFALYSSFIHD